MCTPLTDHFPFELHPTPPYDFERTVQKPGGWDLFTPFEHFEDRTLWTALHIGGQVVGLKLRGAGTTADPVLLVDAYVVRATPENRANTETVIGLKLAPELDLAAFYELAAEDPILKHTLSDLYGMHPTAAADVFAAGALAICLQMTTLKRSLEMMDSLILRYGEPVRFDGKEVYAWPTAERIAGVTPEELAKTCNVGYRAKFLVALAEVVTAGFPTLEELETRPHEDAKRKLMELPGIGDYSADIMTTTRGFPIDVWSADVFGMLFNGEQPAVRRAAVDEIKEEGLRRWGEWSWLAFMYVVHDLEGLSARLGTPLRLE